MRVLTFRDWNKPERKLAFVGYNSARTVCYIYNEEPTRRAIDLWLPSGFGLRFPANPIPSIPPDQIWRSVLNLPSFGPFMSKGQVACYHWLKSRDTSTPAKDPVPLESLHPREGNWDAPDLHEKLRQALAEELQRLRRDYNAEEQKIAKRPADQQAEAHRALANTFSFKRDDFSTVSMFDATLDDVKAGLFELWTKVLQQEFIEHHGLDREKIGLDYLLFYRWIRLEAKRLPDQTLAALAARVRYNIHFEDNTGCWLENIHERALTTPQEHEDFDRFESVSQKAKRRTKEAPNWHSPDFREIYLHDRKGKRKDMATLHNSLRALCKLLSDHVGEPIAYTEIEPKIGDLARELDKADNISPPSPSGSRRIYDLLRTKPGMKLQKWRVLTVTGTRERFIKLSPPRAN